MADAGFQPVADAGAAPVFFGNSLWIQGGKHICDGATDKLTEAMDNYEAHLSSVQAIRGFFAESGNREFFKHECLVRAGGVDQAYLFECKPPSISEWRWGSMLECTEWVLERHDALVRYWRGKKMAMRQQQKAADKAQKKVGGRDPHAESKQRVQQVSDAIASPFFWAFSRMLIMVGQVIQTVSAWLESCPCHSESQELTAA